MVTRLWNLEQLTEENLKEQIEKAREAGKNADATEPRAESVLYDKLDNRITIYLKTGAVSSFPPSLVQGLADATPEEIADFFVTPEGRSIRWESLDLDFSIPGLVANVFGTREWMAKISRQGAKFKIAAKILDFTQAILDITQQTIEGSPQQNLPRD